jgi:hypothetical protein
VTTIAVLIVERAITWEAMQKISQKSTYKTDTKNKAKGLRATIFAIAKLED